MKKINKIVLGLAAVTVAGAGVLSLGSQVEAHRGDFSIKGPNYTQERHEVMQNIFKNNDYDAWVELMDGRGPAGRISREQFGEFSKIHQLVQEGKIDEAKALRASLGLGKRDGNGAGQGNGFGDRQFRGES